MKMADFIEQDLEDILQEWEEFAKEQRPGSVGLSPEELRDLVEAVLRSVTEDMRTGESEEQRHKKSRGGRSPDPDRQVIETARGHAADRLTQGFTLNQLVAEYRALRASVIRRWRKQVPKVRQGDVEELIRFNEAIDETLSEAVGWYNARLEDARDLLNGVLAHDLRSPLGAILTSAELLLHDDDLDGRQTRTALRMRNSASRIQSMLSDLLDFTRTRLGTGLPMKAEDSSMERIIGVVVEEQRAAYPEIRIREEASGDLSGRWDPSRIEQMLENLTTNAVKHGEGSPVTVAAKGLNGSVSVSVHNQKGTISNEEQRVIFDPLRRVAIQRRRDHSGGAGLGLGLYIARQIAEAHEGSIDVESSPEAGTTFTVRLPRRPKASAATAGLT